MAIVTRSVAMTRSDACSVNQAAVRRLLGAVVNLTPQGVTRRVFHKRQRSVL